MVDDLDEAKTLKIVLSTYEELSGLKINFHQNELFCFGKTKERSMYYGFFFRCKECSLPFKYLGMPMHHHRILNKDWIIIQERFQKKLSCWKSKLLLIGGRLV